MKKIFFLRFILLCNFFLYAGTDTADATATDNTIIADSQKTQGDDSNIDTSGAVTVDKQPSAPVQTSATPNSLLMFSDDLTLLTFSTQRQKDLLSKLGSLKDQDLESISTFITNDLIPLQKQLGDHIQQLNNMLRKAATDQQQKALQQALKNAYQFSQALNQGSAVLPGSVAGIGGSIANPLPSLTGAVLSTSQQGLPDDNYNVTAAQSQSFQQQTPTNGNVQPQQQMPLQPQKLPGNAYNAVGITPQEPYNPQQQTPLNGNVQQGFSGNGYMGVQSQQIQGVTGSYYRQNPYVNWNGRGYHPMPGNTYGVMNPQYVLSERYPYRMPGATGQNSGGMPANSSIPYGGDGRMRVLNNPDGSSLICYSNNQSNVQETDNADTDIADNSDGNADDDSSRDRDEITQNHAKSSAKPKKKGFFHKLNPFKKKPKSKPKKDKKPKKTADKSKKGFNGKLKSLFSSTKKVKSSKKNK